MYLGFELAFVAVDGFEIRLQAVVVLRESLVVALELFDFPPGSSVLEPNRHLPGL